MWGPALLAGAAAAAPVIGADSEPDGVIVSLGERGIVRLRLRAD